MKNQMWKKGVCLGMAAMMTAGMLAGCGESSESKDTAMVQTGEDGVVESGRYTLDADTPAWKLDTKEDTTLTWYVNAEWWNTEWGNDVVTKQIQKDMNVNIDFVVGDDTKLNTFFAGGDMPDIITISMPAQVWHRKRIPGHMHCRIWQTIMIHIFTKLPPPRH